MQFDSLELRPRIQDMKNGKFRPIVVFDDHQNGGAVFGDPVATQQEASDLARSACDAVFPDGHWRDGWLTKH